MLCSYQSFSLSSYLELQIIFPCRHIGPAIATLDPRPATISQTPMILDGSKRSFSGALYVLDIFANVSGLKANYEKTEALWTGSHKNTNAVIYSFE